MKVIDRIKQDYISTKLKTIGGYDKAVIGIDPETLRLVYSGKKILSILIETMSPADAQEFFDFNFMNFYMGEGSPIICDDNY